VFRDRNFDLKTLIRESSKPLIPSATTNWPWTQATYSTLTLPAIFLVALSALKFSFLASLSVLQCPAHPGLEPTNQTITTVIPFDSKWLFLESQYGRQDATHLYLASSSSTTSI
jgi:hypothetical protein